MKMSRNYFPTKEETDLALERLRLAKAEFERRLAEQEQEQARGAGPAGARLFAEAARAFRRALLDPHLPPV